ncbi:MAG: LCP family protein [Chloroflexota bacterium]|nr:LCP family protein [Chloroflexota bacterium]
MKRKKTLYLIVGTLALALIIAGGIFGAPLIQKWNQPLAPGLELSTPTSSPFPLTATDSTTATENTADSVSVAETMTSTPPGTNTAEPTSTPKPKCGGPALMTVLALGVDTRADNYLYGLADVIRIVRVDFVTPKITLLSLPRDLWVEIPGIEDHYDITHGKLNQSYFYGTEGMGYYDGPGGPPGLMARTLALNFDLYVDHYGSVNMITFVRMVDAVGGLDIYLPTDVDGRPVDEKTADMGYFEAGQQHFSGDEALRFSRIRKIDSVFARMDRQTMVLCALRDKIISPSVLPRLPKTIASFQDSIITDLSPAQMSQLACLAPQINRENLLFASIPQEILKPDRAYNPIAEDITFIWKADFDIIRDYIARFQAGTWPDKPKEPTCP